MNVFALRDHLIQDYLAYISSFIQICKTRLRKYVNQSLAETRYNGWNVRISNLEKSDHA
jgi:hypothetical protein